MKFHVAPLALVLVFIACGPIPSARMSSGLTMIHVSDDGPIGRSVPLTAAVSLMDLEATILGSGRPGLRVPSDCLSQMATRVCWSQPPSDSLLIALQNPPPDLWGKCSRDHLGDATLSGTSITITVEVLKSFCTSVAAPQARYSLYAIPLAGLPETVLTLIVSDEGQGIDTQSKLQFPWKFETVVDLRRPLPNTIDPSLRTRQVEAAVAAAWAAIPHAWDASEVAARRWDQNLSCSDQSTQSTGSESTLTAGYLVALYYTVDLKSSPWWATKLAWFHIAGSKVVRCDR